MSSGSPERRLSGLQIALVCALVALVAAALSAWVSMWGGGGDTSALVRVPAIEPLGNYIAERHDDWDFVEPATRYDGIYYYAIALDPFATGEEHTLIDSPAYRYGHPGMGWVAAVVSLGSGPNLPWALLLVGLVGMAGAAYFAARISEFLGMSSWWGMAVAVNPGLLYAVTVDTPEPLAALVLGAALLAWLRRHLWIAGALLVALCLIKEAFVFVPMGLAIFEIVAVARGGDRKDLFYKLGILSLGPLALAAWFVYLHGRLGVWSFTDGPENLAAPIAGFVETLRFAAVQQQEGQFQSGAISLPLLVGVAVVLVAGIVRAARIRTPIDPVFIPSALLIFCLSWLALLYPKDMLRNVSALLYLLPWVFLARATGPLAGEGEREAEGGALAEGALDPDAPAVALDDQSRQVEA